jgi:hypothetical protein
MGIKALWTTCHAVLTGISMKMAVFWEVAPCGRVSIPTFQKSALRYSLGYGPWCWRQGPLKRGWTYTSLHGAATQKTAIFMPSSCSDMLSCLQARSTHSVKIIHRYFLHVLHSHKDCLYFFQQTQPPFTDLLYQPRIDRLLGILPLPPVHTLKRPQHSHNSWHFMNSLQRNPLPWSGRHFATKKAIDVC